MQFRGGDGAVLSGLMKGAAEVRNRPAVVDIPVGKGRVVVFATNPCYRWQNLGEFNMLFNADEQALEHSLDYLLTRAWWRSERPRDRQS
jgi:hypothetical protein